MQRLSLAFLHATTLPPAAACHQCLLRLTSLTALLQTQPLAALPPLHAALGAFRTALTSTPASTWPQAAAAFQQSALYFTIAQQPPARAGPTSPQLTAALDALLTTAVALSLLCQSSAPQQERGLQPTLPLHHLLTSAIGDVRAACLEKWGCAPPIELTAGPHTAAAAAAAPCLALPALVAHSVTELLKNAAKSTMERHGVLGLDDAPPITVAAALALPPGAGAAGAMLSLTVQDSGVGPPALQPHPAFPYFASAWAAPLAQQEGADWRYSRAFGSALYGKGVGLARARLHAAIHGGSLSLAAGEGGQGGATAVLTLRCNGGAEFDPHVGLPVAELV